MKDRLLQADQRHAAWVAEREDQRTRDMYSQIGWMLFEAILVTGFLACFH
jgi:hypothetical protein